MAANKTANRDKHERDRDRQIVAEMYLKGYTNRAISQHLSKTFSTPEKEYYLSHVTVASDVKFLLKEWLKNTTIDIDHLKARELEKLNKLENTYWEAWEKSFEDYEKTSKKISQSGSELPKEKEGKSFIENSKKQEMSILQIKNMGNPAYLQGVERCIERRCKIVGIDAPQKHEVDVGIGFMGFLKKATTDEEES